MDPYEKLEKRIEELVLLKLSKEEIIKEGVKSLREYIKDLTFEERKEFFIPIERNRKLEELLSNI